MPAEFQKVFDNFLKEFPQANAFIDDILIASKGTRVRYCICGKNFEEVGRIKRFLETTEMQICKNGV